MATQISDNLNPSNSAQGPRQWLADWLRPRATDRDEAFRERSIRSTLLVVIFFGWWAYLFPGGSLASGWALEEDNWFEEAKKFRI